MSSTSANSKAPSTYLALAWAMVSLDMRLSVHFSRTGDLPASSRASMRAFGLPSSSDPSLPTMR